MTHRGRYGSEYEAVGADSSTEDIAEHFRGKRVLVAGGTGFVGSSLVRGLVELSVGVEVVSFANRQPSDALDGVEYISGDLEDADEVDQLVAEGTFDHIFNASGFLSKTRDPEAELALFRNHFTTVKSLVDAVCRRGGVMLVHVGSAEEYGAAPSPQLEEGPARPVSSYGLAKAIGSQYVLMRSAQSALRAVVLRPFNIYGPGARQGIIPYVVERARSGDPIEITEGGQLRDFIHVADFVRAVFLLARAQWLTPRRINGQVFNVCNGEGVLIREIVAWISELLGAADRVKLGAVSYRTGEVMEAIGSSKKLEAFTGFQRQVSLREGLRRLVEGSDVRVTQP